MIEYYGMTAWSLLATLLGDGAPEAPKQPAGGGGGGLEQLMPLLFPFLIIILLYQFLIARPQRREQARRDEILRSLKKNDPVVTIGGILGTVVSVAEDGSEVTIRVDDSARLRVQRSAIRDVLRKEGETKEAEAK